MHVFAAVTRVNYLKMFGHTSIQLMSHETFFLIQMKDIKILHMQSLKVYILINFSFSFLLKLTCEC